MRVKADLVIRADGTWSKVRPLLTDKVPVYTGIRGVNVTIHNVDERYSNLAELVSDGLTKLKGLMLQRNSNGLISNHLFLRVEEGWEKKEFASASRKGPQSAQEFLLRFLEGWNPEFLDFIRNCDDEPIHGKIIVSTLHTPVAPIIVIDSRKSLMICGTIPYSCAHV